MKKLLRPAAANVTRPRLARFHRFAGIFLLGFCTVLICAFALNQAVKRSVLAQNADLRAIARRYPKHSREQQMAVLRARQEMLHPKWRDLSFTQAADRLLRFVAAAFPHTAGSSTPPLAPFAGNLTFITAPNTDDLYIHRQSDCSLTLTTGTFSYTFGGIPTLTADGITTHYDATLHSEAQLTTKAGVFANGCADPTLGTSTRRGMYLGMTSQNQALFAAAGYYSPKGTNGLYYGNADPATNTVGAFNVDTSDPNVVAVTAGDLNGDGMADIVAIDESATAAVVNVRLAHLDGTIGANVSYAVPGTKTEAATVDDVNGDGKADVIVASVDSSSQEYVSVLIGNGDGTLNAAVSVKVPTPTYPTSAGGNGGSGPPIIEHSSPLSIVNLITADLGGNGHKDIVTSNGTVLLNNGTGTFTVAPAPAFPARVATSSYGPNLTAGDLNNDNKQDIVFDDGQQISIYLSNGDGTFKAGRAYASSGSVGFVTVTDLDGDGNADVYEGLANGGFFGGDQFNVGQGYALMGNGDGTLRGAESLPFLFTGQNVADLNNDGVLDVVGLSASEFTAVVSFTSYIGKGDGSFAASSVLSVSPVTIGGQPCYFGQVDSFALGDFNGDGKLDLAYLAGDCAAGVFLATGKGDGSFNTPVLLFQQSTAETVTGIQAADINHDGKADLVYAYSASTNTATTVGFAVQLSNGDGTFKTPVMVQTGTSPSNTLAGPAIEAIGDVNGDGFPDLFVTQGTIPVCSGDTCTSTYQFELYLGKGDGTFQAPYAMPANPAGPNTAGFSQVALADMNGDGHLDVVALQNNSVGGLGIYLGKGDGTFATPSNVNYAGEGLAVADFNGDGKLDVAVSGYFSGVLFGNGDGTVQSSSNGNGGLLPSEQVLFEDFFNPAVTADFNGDGKPDFLFANTLLLSQAASSTSPTLLGTNTALTASSTSAVLGSSLMFTATVTPASGTVAPTGTVTFSDGTASIGTGTLASGIATFSTANLAVGAHSIAASYGGDSGNAASKSTAVTVTITAAAADFSIGLAPASGTVAPGKSITTTISITPSAGFNQQVSLACSGAPKNTACTIAPSSITPTGSAASTATLTVQTNVKTAALDRPFAPGGNGPPNWPAAVVFAGLAGLFTHAMGRKRRRKWSYKRLLGISALMMGVLIAGCGGSSHATPTGTSTLTITATAGPTTHTATYMLTVQ